MNIETLQKYCLSKKGVTEEFPFGDSTLVFKVMGKVFALTSLDRDFTVNLKCDPERAIDLREQFPAVQPGYHMNKMHWNTIYIDGSIPVNFIYEWIDHSYNLVVGKLPARLKNELKEL